MSELHGSDSYLRLVTFAGSEPVALWRRDEIADVWAHQLAAGLTKCIEELGLVHALRCESLSATCRPPMHTLGELLHHAHPDLQLLTLVGKWMERTLGDVDELLPRDIALSLFNLAIVLARLRCDARLISGSDSELARRAEWVAARPWIDDETRSLMQQASKELGGTDSQAAR